MIPRLKAPLRFSEWVASLTPGRHAVPRFEAAFAAKFEMPHGVSFAYGRSGIFYLLKAWGLEGAQVILPAYTCVVVAHAVVRSGNIPVFVDAVLPDFNMSLDHVEHAITEKTRVVIGTHLFGYPLNVKRLQAIIANAEQTHGHKIYVIQDCAHSFGAKWEGERVSSYGDAAIYGLNISKTITSIFGGMVLCRDNGLAEKLRRLREQDAKKPSILKSWKRFFYLSAVMIGFHRFFYGWVNRLERRTSWLDRLTVYYRPDEIDFPKDFADPLLPIEARVGLRQLKRYEEVVEHRRTLFRYYRKVLEKFPDLELPPEVEGATYSHFVCLTEHRQRWLDWGLRSGLQLGRLIEYAIDQLPAYRAYARNPCPVAARIKDRTVNFPMHLGVSVKRLKKIFGKREKFTRFG